jgi:hypothetical protein
MAPASAAGQGESRVVLLVECTAQMQPFWPDLRTLYVEVLLRYIDKFLSGRVELALVLVGADRASEQLVDGELDRAPQG